MEPIVFVYSRKAMSYLPIWIGSWAFAIIVAVLSELTAPRKANWTLGSAALNLGFLLAVIAVAGLVFFAGCRTFYGLYVATRKHLEDRIEITESSITCISPSERITAAWTEVYSLEQPEGGVAQTSVLKTAAAPSKLFFRAYRMA